MFFFLFLPFIALDFAIFRLFLRYKKKMSVIRLIFTYLIIFIGAITVSAQERQVENRPYCDLRPFHFGVVVGTHFQDLELQNAGPLEYANEDGVTVPSLITADQDKWDNGFHIGVLGEVRLDQNFALRVAPSLYFGSRHLTFRDLRESNPDLALKQQLLKSVYIGCNFDMIFAAPRFNNHRPYIMAGIAPMFNLNTRGNDYIQLKRSEVFLEAGLGCDLYLPFFKLRPELKFMYGISNALNTSHAKNLSDKTMLPYALSVNKANTKMIAITFYFE